MVTLVCAVVGAAGAAFAVDIDTSRTVSELKQEIKASCPELVQCSAELLALYVAQRGGGFSIESDGSWLRADDDDARALKRGSVTNRIASFLCDEVPMAATSQLSSHTCFSAGFAPARGDIHILVELPKDSEDVAFFKRHLKWIATLYFSAGLIILAAACITMSRSGLGDLVMLWLIFVTAVVVVQHFERELAHGRAELAEAYRHMGYESIP